MTKQQLFAEVMSLDAKERDELIEDLRQVAAEDDLTLAQLAELHRRIDAADRGEVTFLPGEQVMRELREHLGRQ